MHDSDSRLKQALRKYSFSDVNVIQPTKEKIRSVHKEQSV